MPPSPWTDGTVIPWGTHKGKTLKDLPASYLLWLFEQTWIKDWPGLYLYLKAHEDQLLAEKREQAGNQDDDDGFKSFEDYKNYRN
jgi:hypothetical protein